MNDDFAVQIAQLQHHIRTRRSAVRAEEPIKTALILPFIRAFGYDVFDPYEVFPGYTQDGSGKVDYAIKDGESVRALVMLSSTPADLGTERAQRLIDAFAKTGASTAIITDGSTYRVHADPSRTGTLDPEPVLVLALGADTPVSMDGLEHLTRDAFDIATLVAGAADRRFQAAVSAALHGELDDPSGAFVDAIAGRLESDHLRERLDLRDVLVRVGAALGTVQAVQAGAPVVAVTDEAAMTLDETTAFHIVRAIAARLVDPERVAVRPAKSYVAVLLDDNNRRPIARIHFKAISAKYLGTFVEGDESRNAIPGPNAIYALEDKILARIRELEAAEES